MIDMNLSNILDYKIVGDDMQADRILFSRYVRHKVNSY